ncbi:hypothetical protein E1165_12330 [Micromonospora sp. KC723]|nr:hypothetical protein E1165_12330 [Micromonospora sp. KC723]
MDLTADQSAELRALITSSEVSTAAVGTRARIVLWHAEGRMKKDIAVLAGGASWVARSAVVGPNPGTLPLGARTRCLEARAWRD